MLARPAPAAAQLPFWLLPNNSLPGPAPTYYSLDNYSSVRFSNNGQPKPLLLTTNPDRCFYQYTSFIQEPWFYGNGKPMFWLDFNGEPASVNASGCINYVSGSPFTPLGVAATISDELIVPDKPYGAVNDCSHYLVIGYVANASAANGSVQYYAVAPSGFPSNINNNGEIDIEPRSTGYTPGDAANPSHSPQKLGAGTWGRVAAAAPNATGRRFVYVAAESGINPIDQGGIWRYEVVGRTTNYVRQLSMVTTALDAVGNPTIAAQAKIVGPSLGGFTMGTFRTNELEISRDGARIAWGDANGNTVYMASLDPATGGIGSVGPAKVSIPGLSVSKINGVEFSPLSNNVLYVTAGADNSPGKTDGLFKLTRTGSGTGTSFTVQRVGGTGALANRIASSYLEADVNGGLVALAPDFFVPITPTAVGAASPGVIQAGIAHAYPLTAPAAPRRLPHQIDGWDYNYGAYLTGPAYVAVGGSAPAATQTYTARQLPNATYTFRVRRNGNVLSTTTSASNQLTYTFAGSVGDAYAVEVTVQSAAGCNDVSTGSLTVALTNGDPSGIAAAGGPSELVYPNPAASQLTIRSDESAAGAVVEVRDARGEVRLRTAVPTAGAPLNLDVSALPEGVYVVRVLTAHGVRSERLLIARNR